jgi:hypothetical protein
VDNPVNKSYSESSALNGFTTNLQITSLKPHGIIYIIGNNTQGNLAMGSSISPNNASLECMAERRTNLKSKPEFPHLFQPCKIGQMILTNRVVLPAMGNNYGTEDGSVTDRQIDYYNERAIGGAGLLITEMVSIDSPTGQRGSHQLRINDDKYIAG